MAEKDPFAEEFPGYDEAIAAVDAENINQTINQMNIADEEKAMPGFIESLPGGGDDKAQIDAAAAGASGEPAPPEPPVKYRDRLQTGRGLPDNEISESLSERGLLTPADKPAMRGRMATPEMIAKIRPKAVVPSPDKPGEVDTGLPNAEAVPETQTVGDRPIVTPAMQNQQEEAIAQQTGIDKETVNKYESRARSVDEMRRSGDQTALLQELNEAIRVTQKITYPNGTVTLGDTRWEAKNKALLAQKLKDELRRDGFDNLSEEDIRGIRKAMRRAGSFDMSSQRAGKIVDEFIRGVLSDIDGQKDYYRKSKMANIEQAERLSIERGQLEIEAEDKKAIADANRLIADAEISEQELEAIQTALDNNDYGKMVSLRNEADIGTLEKTIQQNKDWAETAPLEQQLKVAKLNNELLQTQAQNPLYQAQADLNQAIAEYQANPDSEEARTAMVDSMRKIALANDIFDAIDSDDREEAEAAYNAAVGRISTMGSQIETRRLAIKKAARDRVDDMYESDVFAAELEGKVDQPGAVEAFLNEKYAEVEKKLLETSQLGEMETLYIELIERARNELLPAAKRNAFEGVDVFEQTLNSVTSAGDKQIATPAVGSLVPVETEGQPGATDFTPVDSTPTSSPGTPATGTQAKPAATGTPAEPAATGAQTEPADTGTGSAEETPTAPIEPETKTDAQLIIEQLEKAEKDRLLARMKRKEFREEKAREYARAQKIDLDKTLKKAYIMWMKKKGYPIRELPPTGIGKTGPVKILNSYSRRRRLEFLDELGI